MILYGLLVNKLCERFGKKKKGWRRNDRDLISIKYCSSLISITGKSVLESTFENVL